MAELQMQPGTKLKVAFDTAVGQQTDFNMMATFKGAIDEAYFLISAPMLAGKPLILDENQKLLFQYTEGENTFMLAGYPESVEKASIRTLWKMRQVAEHRTFFKRRDERFKVSMRLRYLRDEAPEDQLEEAMTIDVSAGGLAMYLNDFPDVGEALQVKLPVVRVNDQRNARGRSAPCRRHKSPRRCRFAGRAAPCPGVGAGEAGLRAAPGPAQRSLGAVGARKGACGKAR